MQDEKEQEEKELYEMRKKQEAERKRLMNAGKPKGKGSDTDSDSESDDDAFEAPEDAKNDEIENKDDKADTSNNDTQNETEESKQKDVKKDDKLSVKDIKKAVQRNTISMGSLDILDLTGKKKSSKKKKPILKKGYMLRKGFFGNWQKRWFVLRVDKFMYFKSKEAWQTGSSSEGSIFMQYAVVDEEDVGKKKGKPFSYNVHSRGKDHWVDPGTLEEKDEWLQALKKVIAERYS